MSKSSYQSSGLSKTTKSQASKTEPTKSSPEQSNKEQQALALINQGKLKEAEAIYRDLIRTETKSYKTYSNLAAICGMQGRLDESIELLRKALQLNPNFPDAYNNLGIALKKQGNLDNAIDSYNKALELKPDYPDAHNNLGNVFKEKGDLSAAINSYKTALYFKPNFADAHNNLGNAFKEKGDLSAAIDSYNTALQLNPNCPEAHNNLGNAFKEKGDLSAAIDSYNTAIQLKPNYPDAHNNLGNALKQQGNLTAAIASYNTAIQLKPNYPDAHNNLGNALNDKGDLDEAIINHKRALELDPKNSKALYCIGRVQAVKGNLKGSKNSFLKAIELDPNYTSALFELSKNIESVEDLKELDKKLNGVKKTELDKRQAAMLEFAAANLHHKSKNYTNAAQHLAKANKLKLSFYPSDLSNRLLQTNLMTALASQIRAGKPSDGEGKIFIVGAPRCGSTLLETVLSTNPNIRCLGESGALRQAFAQITIKNSTQGITPSLSDAYTNKTKEALAKHSHSVDKSLYNFYLTEAIVRAMPSARIVHCRRHPLDNILSMLRSNLKAGNNYTSDPLDAAKFLIDQEKAMSRLKRKHEKHIYTFDYDAFVSKPKKTLHPLIKWLGLEWSERYLHPESSIRLIKTASVIQARQPINNKSVGTWKNYRELLKPAEEALLESGIFEL